MYMCIANSCNVVHLNIDIHIHVLFQYNFVISILHSCMDMVHVHVDVHVSNTWCVVNCILRLVRYTCTSTEHVALYLPTHVMC